MFRHEPKFVFCNLFLFSLVIHKIYFELSYFSARVITFTCQWTTVSTLKIRRLVFTEGCMRSCVAQIFIDNGTTLKVSRKRMSNIMFSDNSDILRVPCLLYAEKEAEVFGEQFCSIFSAKSCWKNAGGQLEPNSSWNCEDPAKIEERKKNCVEMRSRRRPWWQLVLYRAANRTRYFAEVQAQRAAKKKAAKKKAAKEKAAWNPTHQGSYR